jgi:hypothetical protein
MPAGKMRPRSFGLPPIKIPQDGIEGRGGRLVQPRQGNRPGYLPRFIGDAGGGVFNRLARLKVAEGETCHALMPHRKIRRNQALGEFQGHALFDLNWFLGFLGFVHAAF